MNAPTDRIIETVVASGEPERTHMSINADGWAAIGRRVMAEFWPESERPREWCQEDWEETMISLITALRYYAEDVETLTWEHLHANAMERFHTDIERAKYMDSVPENYPVPEVAS